ncbi:MAG TPA: 5'-nucleotidase C-terminal domain-containing protein [Pyrinomonadaceae bacterium]|nr:5'-nucleotidase C-terminal domain-containing protein [Pyrinomonadaceae bacterium]
MRISGLLFFLILFCDLAVVAQNTETVRVTILHVNDTYQFISVEGGKLGGLARVRSIRNEVVKENPNTLFTLGGDTLSPSVESRTYRGAQMIDAWNVLGLDYAVFGNHEFDIKSDELLKRMKESTFTWLGANVIDIKTGKLFGDTPPFVIREIGGVKIGIVGLLLPEAKETSSMEPHIQVTDFCETAKTLVPKMKAVGANTIIGLTHMFMSQDKKVSWCADFDLILGGHEHTLLQSSANGTPIFKMTADAREVGRFDLFIDKKTGKMVSMDWKIIPVNDSVPDAPEFAPVIAKYKDLIEQLSVRIGATSVPLDALSYSSRTRETNVGNFIADAYRSVTGADIGFVNGGSIRADLLYNPGVLTKRDVLSILPFNNPIVKIEVSGTKLLEVLEHGVARSREDNEPGRFPQVSGMKFKFDASKLPGQRVVEATVGGKPIDPNAVYTIATSNFLVGGGDGYTMLKDAKVLIPADKAEKDSEVFEQAIKASPNATISPRLEGRITRLN